MRVRPRHRRALIAALGVALLAVAALAPEAMAGAFRPESGGSPNADDISTLYEITLYIAIVIFVGVEGALIWSLVRFRARRDGPAAAQVRGNTPLELGWTIGAALIVVVLAAITFVYLDDIENPARSGPGDVAGAAGVEYASIDQPDPPGGEALTIAVNGQQFLWRYDYINEEPLTEDRPVFAYHEMVVPVDRTVVLRLRASDVIHSWWIPELGGKADTVPGHVNETWFKISEPGVYEGACTELCGAGHADMRARVRAVPAAEYEQWLERQRSDILEAQEELARAREEARQRGERF